MKSYVKSIITVFFIFLSACQTQTTDLKLPTISSDNFLRILKKDIIDKDPMDTNAFEAYRTSHWSWKLTPLFDAYEPYLEDGETWSSLIKEHIA